jgi:hypothetical protein
MNQLSFNDVVQLLGQFILGQNNFRVFKSSMTTFVVCHFMVKILHKLAILDVRILNHSVANWNMIAILPFILPSPKRLLLVGSTVYPRNLRQSRNH